VAAIPRELRNLDTFYNPVLQNLENPQEVANTAFCMALVEEYGPCAFVGMQNDHVRGPEPKDFKEAMARPAKEKEKWWKSVCQEFKSMHDKTVWKLTRRSQVPKHKKIIGNKWVFKIKDNGFFQSRTVAKGFSQVPGVDFTQNFAPVINDVTFRLALTYKLIYGLDSNQFDVDTAFLYGELEEEIYMELPEGYVEFLEEIGIKGITYEDFCVLLLKAIYGLVQAARQWWKKFKTRLITLGYKASLADPCLFLRKLEAEEVLSITFVYVDDGGCLAKTEIIAETLKGLSKEFLIKDLGPLKNYVGCQLIENPEEKEMWILQPKLIEHMEKVFGSQLSGREAVVPAAPKTGVVRPKEDDEVIDAEKQSMYRSGVGMLLYLIKHSRPEICNAVRELTKVLDRATPGHYKAMLRTMKYIMETKSYGLHMKPIKEGKLFKLVGKADSEFCGDKETRTSVYGFILYFCRVPVSWRSKMGRSVTLSSTEAEYVSISELAKEILFVKQVLEEMGIEFEYPIVI